MFAQLTFWYNLDNLRKALESFILTVFMGQITAVTENALKMEL